LRLCLGLTGSFLEVDPKQRAAGETARSPND